MAFLKCIFFLSFWSFTGVMAADSSMMHYQPKNSSVCLHVKKQPPHRNGVWTFNGEFVADKELINKNYSDRVFISSENMTLCIHRLMVNDTGIFKASYTSGTSQISDEHQIIVQELVPTPVITVIPKSNFNLSEESCNFTVNCSVQNDWLWSICDEESCRTSQRSFSKFNISIFTKSTAVVCSGNNHVSVNNISKSFSALCALKSIVGQDKELQPVPDKFNIVNFIFPLIVIPFILCAIIMAIIRKMWKRKHDQETTSAAQLIQSGPLETQPPSEPRVSTSSSEADPSYENVETNSIPRHEQVFSESQMVDTVYSVPRKPASCIKTDKRNDLSGNEKKQETLTSGSVSVNEEQKLTYTETVYSVLQLPQI